MSASKTRLSCPINRQSHAVAVKKSRVLVRLREASGVPQSECVVSVSREGTRFSLHPLLNLLRDRINQACNNPRCRFISCRAKCSTIKISGVRLTSLEFLPRFSSSIRFSMAGKSVRNSVHGSLHLPASQQLVATLLSNREYDGRTTVGHQSDRATTVPKSQPNGGSILA